MVKSAQHNFRLILNSLTFQPHDAPKYFLCFPFFLSLELYMQCHFIQIKLKKRFLRWPGPLKASLFVSFTSSPLHFNLQSTKEQNKCQRECGQFDNTQGSTSLTSLPHFHYTKEIAVKPIGLSGNNSEKIQIYEPNVWVTDREFA